MLFDENGRAEYLYCVSENGNEPIRFMGRFMSSELSYNQKNSVTERENEREV